MKLRQYFPHQVSTHVMFSIAITSSPSNTGLKHISGVASSLYSNKSLFATNVFPPPKEHANREDIPKLEQHKEITPPL